jgi:hypothetical protein
LTVAVLNVMAHIQTVQSLRQNSWYVFAICKYKVFVAGCNSKKNMPGFIEHYPVKNTMLWKWNDWNTTGLHFTLYTLHFTLYTLHFTRVIYLANFVFTRPNCVPNCKQSKQWIKNLAFDYKIRRYSLWFVLFCLITFVYTILLQCNNSIYYIKYSALCTI